MNNHTAVLSCSLLLFLPLLLLSHGVHGALRSVTSGTADGSEEWGYIEVRPKAHMFWWLYKSPFRVDNNGASPWPVVLWLQGGPGASGVGIGNFEEIGPLDTHLNPRNSTWLQLADLLFVDNPVGTGYSYVEDNEALVRTDGEAGEDLTTLLKKLYNDNERLQKSALYIVAESYGGKYAVVLGLSIVKAIRNRELELKFGGVALGNSWISAEDFVFSWGPLLADVSRLDNNGVQISNRMAKQIQGLIQNGSYREATDLWQSLESVIMARSNNVDFYNFLLDSDMETVASSLAVDAALEMYIEGGGVAMRKNNNNNNNKYARYLSDSSSGGGLSELMDGVIREKLKIIPKNFSWGKQADLVFNALSVDFMKPRIKEVDQLLSEGVNVTIYNGQLDVICGTRGVEAWVQKLKWVGLRKFTNLERTPLYCSSSRTEGTKGFYKSYRNLNFYWVLGAGHFVPVNQPCTALKMLSEITQSPASIQ